MNEELEYCEECDGDDMKWSESADGDWNVFYCKSTGKTWGERI